MYRFQTRLVGRVKALVQVGAWAGAGAGPISERVP